MSGARDVGRGTVHWLRVLALALVVALPARTEVLTVHPDYTGTYFTIQEAVNAAADGDEIVLTDGVFRGAGNTNVLVVGKVLTIRSASGDPSACILDGQGDRQCLAFEFIGDSTRIVGIGFRGGGGPAVGGAILLRTAPGLISQCVFSDNESLGGAAFVVQTCHVTVEETAFIGNLATWSPGGAIAVLSGSLDVRACTFVDNGAPLDGQGGAIFMYRSGPLTVDRSIFAFSRFGNAIHCDPLSPITITCSNIYGNPGGDWVGPLAGMEGIDGNFSADPLFCAPPPEGTYTLRPGSPCGPDGPCGLIGALPVGCEQPEPIPPPPATVLGPPLPNPTSNGVTLTLDVASGAVGAYRLRVYDLAGRRILERVIEAPAPASYAVGWDGRGAGGQATPAGVYFLRLDGPGLTDTRRVVRLR